MSYDAIKDLLDEMLKAESSMYDLYTDLLQSITNEEINSVLHRIRDDEKRHEANVKSAIDLLKD